MGSSASGFLRQNTTLFIGILVITFLSCVRDESNLYSTLSFGTQAVQTKATAASRHPFLFQTLTLEGYFSLEDTNHAAKDFGNTHHIYPSAILYPKSVSDISSTIKHIFDMGSTSSLTVAARGHGHSLQGQAQADQGVVIYMQTLKEADIQVHTSEMPYVDVSGGELWINILHETLKYGLSPKSWTDYLYLSVGGTLSNAGISGQAFHHGPQINNVHQLEVVTGMIRQTININGIAGKKKNRRSKDHHFSQR